MIDISSVIEQLKLNQEYDEYARPIWAQAVKALEEQQKQLDAVKTWRRNWFEPAETSVRPHVRHLDHILTPELEQAPVPPEWTR